LPRIDGGRGRLCVDDGVQEGDVRVVGQGVQGDAVDGGQGKCVQPGQVEKPVTANNAESQKILYNIITITISSSVSFFKNYYNKFLKQK
jgi:hypothetical protein